MLQKVMNKLGKVTLLFEFISRINGASELRNRPFQGRKIES